MTKRIIDGVSGDGDDLVDAYSGAELRYYQLLGILRDVTDDARQLNFGPQQTWPSLMIEVLSPLTDGSLRQFGFPANCTAQLYFANLEPFRKYGLAPPPQKWSIQEFERIGKAFVKAANPNPRRRTCFFADSIPMDAIRRSLGGALFNETQTRCTMDNPQTIETLNLVYQWMYIDHLLPTQADTAAAETSAGYGGEAPQLFRSGNYALLWSGRYGLDAFRKFNDARKQEGLGPMQLSVVEAPSGGFSNTQFSGRSTTVYMGGKHQQLAMLFLQFLASRDYSLEIAADADGLPPNPIYCRSEAFLRPPDHPDEWKLNEGFARAAMELGIVDSFSPFVLSTDVQREESAVDDAFLNGVIKTAQESVARGARRVNDDIQQALSENPALRPLYDQRLRE
jgi:multiple sugar transport system substrate-binding protein